LEPHFASGYHGEAWFAESSPIEKRERIPILTRKKLLASTAIYTALACVSVTFAQAPVVNIDSHRHGNLAAAQSFIVQAYKKIEAAQHDNQGQLGGHAQKAKDLLTQADAELRLAANVSNSEGR
jgi:hypothetical protein